MRGQKELLELLAASPLALMLLHAGLLRPARFLGRNASPHGWGFAAFFMGLPLIVVAAWELCLRWLSGPELAQALAYVIIVYLCLGFFYLAMFMLSETSRRLHILTTLYVRGPMKLEDLERHYPPLSQVDVRLDRLLAMGQIEERGGRYRLKRRALWLVAVGIEAWRGFLGFV